MGGDKLSGRNSFGMRVIFGLIVASALSLFSAPAAFAQVDTQGYNFTTAVGEEIKKNPTALQILQNIEIAKQRLAEMQSGQYVKTEHQVFIDEQRRIAQEALEKDLASINKKYESFTPKNAFASFVNRTGAQHAELYWDQFDYLNEKIKIATAAKRAILENGGTYAEAQSEFIKLASMSRGEMIKFVSEINIKHGFTDFEMQSYFDANGKLPRYENDDTVSVCYGCEEYEKIKQHLLLEDAQRKEST